MRSFILLSAVPALIWLFPPASAIARSSTDIKIVPGATVMSDAEKALQSDPAHGIEHGVILLEETERNSNLGMDWSIAFHLRAKILSNEGRDLANIEIPFNMLEGDLQEWWGRTILPDGTVRDLPQSELKIQSILKEGLYEVGFARGALVGVVPGCLIDYGYVYRGQGYLTTERVPLQRRWPILKLRYRWIPFEQTGAAWRVAHAEKLSVSAKKDGHSILIVGENLPALIEEPWMPPPAEVYALATLYYLPSTVDPTDPWNMMAKRIDRRARDFCRQTGALDDALAAMKLPADAGLDDKLKRVYDWIAVNMKDSSLSAAEEAETRTDERKTADNTAKSVLKSREATSVELAYLFLGLASRLGAQANIVKGVNRTNKYWDRGLLSLDQFSATFVAVRGPKEPLDDARIVAPGSGLPYGQVPWWNSAARSLLATQDGEKQIVTPVSDAQDNLSETSAKISFGEDNESIHAAWSRSTRGQQFYVERLEMRRLAPEKRQRSIEALCGAGQGVDVAKAEAQGLADLNTPCRLACEGDLTAGGIPIDVGRYRLQAIGPWVEGPPVFDAAKRVHPVVFDYPRMDRESMEITAPHGFKPLDPPAPVHFAGEYGSYSLIARRSPQGFHVDRVFSLTPLKVTPEEYEGLRKFFADVRRADRTPLEFERAEKTEETGP